MAATTIPPPPAAFGVITVDGQDYIERVQVFTTELTISGHLETHTNVRLTMPGVAPFLLKGLTRDVLAKEELVPGVGSFDRRFRFNLRNSQGSTWFFSSGLWVFDDMVVDSMCFGSAQFPYPLIPPIPVPANGTLFYDVQDMGLDTPADIDYFPYTIYFGFHGSYLHPTTTG